MEIKHNAETMEWKNKIRSFADEYLIPWEIEAEMNNGIIPEKASKLMQDKAIELGLSKMDAPTEFGGLDLPMVQQGKDIRSQSDGIDASCPSGDVHSETSGPHRNI